MACFANYNRSLCDQLMHTLRPESGQNGVIKNNGRKILDAPVQIGAIVATSGAMDDSSSLWIQKMDDSLVSSHFK